MFSLMQPIAPTPVDLLLAPLDAMFRHMFTDVDRCLQQILGIGDSDRITSRLAPPRLFGRHMQ
jgi:hypothetical protein